MKISYFLKRLGLLAMLVSACSSQVFAIYYTPDAKVTITGDTCTGGDITGYMEYTTGNSSWYTYGLWVKDEAQVGDVSATFEVTHVNDGFVAGICVDATSSIGTFSGSIIMMSNQQDSVGYLVGAGCSYYGVGLYSEATEDSSTFDVDWTSANFQVILDDATTSSLALGTARGIYLNQEGASIATGEGEYIGGTIYAWNTDASDGNSIGIELALGSQAGDLGASSSVIANCDSAGDSYGLYLTGQSSIGNLAGSILADALTGDAIAIYAGDSTMGSISGTVTAYSKKGESKGIVYDTEQTLQLSGATISATTKSGYGTAIENTTHGIRLLNEGSASTIRGDLNAGGQVLNFAEGQFNVSGGTWTADSVSIGSDSGTAQLTLESVITIEAETLNFYVHALDELSSILIEDGYSLNLENITTINVYLDDGVMESGDFDLTLMDGEIACLSDDVEVNYVLSDSYSADSLSYGTADDGTSFIVSSGAGGSSGGGDIVVPEPCTVSLSFVALAGLLARRRRKP